MKSKINLAILAAIFSLLVCNTLCVQNVNATTPALWWSSTELNTNSVSDCATFGGTVLKNSNAKNVEVTNWTASGSIGNTSITIGCIGTSPEVTALVMAVDRTVSNATNRHNAIQGKVAAYPTVPAVPRDSETATIFRRPLGAVVANTKPLSPMYFYWKTFGVKTDTVKKCYDLARPDFSGKTNFKETKGVELSSSSGTSYVALKCFETGSRATAVIIVVGDDNTQTKSLFDKVSDKISKRQFID
jgi:hypothetical protein